MVASLRWSGALLGVLIFGGSTTAAASEKPAVTLLYERGDVLQCPEEEGLRQAVATKLGYDPFEQNAPAKLFVALRKDATELVASLHYISATGLRGRRTLRSSSADCRELLLSIALAVSIAVDPEQFGAPVQPTPGNATTTSPEAPTAVASAPSTPTPPTPAPSFSDHPSVSGVPPAPSRSTTFLVGAGAIVAHGQTPGAAGAAAVLLGVRQA